MQLVRLSLDTKGVIMLILHPQPHIFHRVNLGGSGLRQWLKQGENGILNIRNLSIQLTNSLTGEGHLWVNIIYVCLVYGTHMMKVTHDRVCIIYALMHEDVELNVGAIIFSAIRKARFLGGNRYGFDGLLTRFLRQQGVPEEKVDYKPPVGLRPLDFFRTKGPAPHSITLTMPSVKLKMMRSQPGCPGFDEPLDNDIPTDKERRMGYSDNESIDEEQSDDGDTGDNFSDDEGADDDMMALV
ncbi:hypothetical protein FXO38_19546 [Capsicum annuum]|nr:hypothetical protein FXO38_19546 [Capsicum annuum]KAF3669224.1 hypothetical protein FXO37_09144 [Capsicum annuum]